MSRYAAFVGLVALISAACHTDTNPVFAPAGLAFSIDPEPLGAVAFEPALDGMVFELPTFAAPVPGRINDFVVLEKTGRGWLVQGAEGSRLRTEFFSLRSEIAGQGGEQGLFAIAFDPSFAGSDPEFAGELYLSFTREGPRRSVLARYRLDATDPNRVDLGSEEVLLAVAQPYSNHNGGHIEFGPDRMLYWSLGDGGSGGDPFDHAQNRGTLLGNILRLDVRGTPDAGLAYAIPPDNPFVGEPGVRAEIWAYGLRNPWRFAFDPVAAGDRALWVGDVGQAMREELTYVQAGENHGWRLREGDVDFMQSPNRPPGSTLIEPVVAYPRDQGVTVVAGRTYQGAAIPWMRDNHIFGDHGSGRVWALSPGAAAPVEIGGLASLVSFHTDRDGELLVVSIAGTVHRLIETGTPPDATPAPSTLSATGIFADLETLEPARGVYAYEVNAPFWSGPVARVKRRFVALPGEMRWPEDSADAFVVPVGTVTVKHFETLDGRRLETRVMVSTRSGWRSYAYLWRSDGSDADLLPRGGGSTTVATPEGDHVVPDAANCFECHRPTGGTMLGVTPLQWSSAQRTGYRLAGLLEFRSANTQPPELARLDDLAAPASARAHAWLASNCSACHRPETGIGSFDLRGTTPLESAGLIDVSAISGGLVGQPGADLVEPGFPENSVLFLRASSDVDGVRMQPTVSPSVPDPDGVAVLEAWVRSLPR